MKWLTNLLKSPYSLALGAAGVLGALLLLSKKDETTPGGGGGQGGGAPFVGPGDRVLLIGDSLGVGLSKPMAALAAASGNAFQGSGPVTGTRIDQWDGKLLDPELAFGPTVAVISLGTNDMKMLDPVKSQSGHVASLIQKLRDAGARVAWVLPPPMPFPDKGVREMIAAAGPDLVVHAEVLDLPRAGDQIHMTPQGYQQFADAVWGCLTTGACPSVQAVSGIPFYGWGAAPYRGGW